MNIFSFTAHKLSQLAKKYSLSFNQVEYLYLRTLDDFVLLEKACRSLVDGDDIEEVSLMIIWERK